MANENNEQKRYRRPAGSILTQAQLEIHGAADKPRLAAIAKWDALTAAERNEIGREIVLSMLDSSDPDGTPRKFRTIVDNLDERPLRVALAIGHVVGQTATDMTRAASAFIAHHEAAAAAFNAARDAKATEPAAVVTDTVATADTAAIDALVDAVSDTTPQDAPPAKRGPGRPSKSVGASVAV